MKVVFRVDASTRIGAGHLMRCLNLADALVASGASVSFVCRDASDRIVIQRTDDQKKVHWLPVVADSTVDQEHDAKQTISALNGSKPDWIIVDSYSLDIAWETMMRQDVHHIMAIDDMPTRRHDCDILLDQNLQPESGSQYAGLVPASCLKLLGPRYSLLQKKFLQIRQSMPMRTGKLEKILIFFTAGDDQHETLKAMKGVAQYGKATAVDVVVGSKNSDIRSIEDICTKRGWGFHCQVNYMPELIAGADLAIGGGGISSWERCALGLPALVVVLAENQKNIAKTLADAGAAVCFGWRQKVQIEDYCKALKDLNGEKIRAMAEKAYRLVDANGADRVSKNIVLS